MNESVEDHCFPASEAFKRYLVIWKLLGGVSSKAFVSGVSWASYHMIRCEFILMGGGLLRKPLRKMGMHGKHHQSNLSGLELKLKGFCKIGPVDQGNQPEEEPS